MKRSPLKRPTLAQVRAWESKPRKPLPRARKAIAKIGRKARREQDAVAACRQEVRARAGGVCEAISTTTEWRSICWTTRDDHPGWAAHHVWPEDRDRGIHDPARGLWLCNAAHEWAHAHPADAALAGLLRPDR